MNKISIADDFSKTPGFRYDTDGPMSGQEFRERLLEPLFNDQNDTSAIIVDLDGVVGYATSFLEEAFGGLGRKFGIEIVLKRLSFISNDEPLLLDEIESYIKNCDEED